MKTKHCIWLVLFVFLLCSCLKDNRQIPERISEDGKNIVGDTLKKNETTDSSKKASPVVETQDTAKKNPVDTNAIVRNTGEQTPSQITGFSASEPSYDESEVTVWTLISVIIGVLAILLSVYSIYKAYLLNRDAFDKIDEVEKGLGNMIPRRYFADYQDETKKAIKKLEEKIKDLESERESFYKAKSEEQKQMNYASNAIDENYPLSRGKMRKKGYFGIVKKTGTGIAVFNDYPKTSEGAYFNVTFSEDEKSCEFAPISLDRIRSVDVIVNAVDYAGVSMNYAKQMEINNWGKAEYDEANKCWRITQKAVITLKA